MLAACPNCGTLHTPTSKERAAGKFRCACKTTWVPPAEELEIVKKAAALKPPGAKKPPAGKPKTKAAAPKETKPAKKSEIDDYWGKIGL